MLLPSTTTGCLLLPNKTPRTTGRLNLQGWTFGVKPEYALGLTDPPSRLSKVRRVGSLYVTDTRAPLYFTLTPQNPLHHHSSSPSSCPAWPTPSGQSRSASP